jgi:hypothetical protein
MVIRHHRSLNLRGTTLEPKVAQRPAAGMRVAHGNHDLEASILERAPDFGAVEVLHFPLRSFEQFEHKVVKVGVGYELLEDRPADVGCDQLQLLAMHRDGGLSGYFRSEDLDLEQVQTGLERGELVTDRRLQAFMQTPRGPIEESPAIQELLRRAWTLWVETNDALRDAHAEADELAQALATVRNSRLMRFSAPARRVYYRMRPSK